MSRALVVEGDRALRGGLARALARRYDVVGVATSAEVSAEINGAEADLIVMALVLPDGDAFDVVVRARRQAHYGICLISSRVA